jgi:hypothetical protein
MRAMFMTRRPCMAMATTLATAAAADMTDACRSSGAPNIRAGAKPGLRYWMTGCSLGFFAMRDYRRNVLPLTHHPLPRYSPSGPCAELGGRACRGTLDRLGRCSMCKGVEGRGTTFDCSACAWRPP